MENKILIEQLSDLIMTKKSTPFLFRSRFERAMHHGINFYKNFNPLIALEFENTLNKLKFISDNSNMTSDGSPRSYVVLVDDIKKLLKKIQ